MFFDDEINEVSAFLKNKLHLTPNSGKQAKIKFATEAIIAVPFTSMVKGSIISNFKDTFSNKNQKSEYISENTTHQFAPGGTRMNWNFVAGAHPVLLRVLDYGEELYERAMNTDLPTHGHYHPVLEIVTRASGVVGEGSLSWTTPFPATIIV
jgi:hypothetical protein